MNNNKKRIKKKPVKRTLPKYEFYAIDFSDSVIIKKIIVLET